MKATDVLYKKLIEPQAGSDLLVCASANVVTIQAFGNSGLIPVSPDVLVKLCAALLEADKAIKQAREKQLAPIAGRELPPTKKLPCAAPASSDAAITKDL